MRLQNAMRIGVGKREFLAGLNPETQFLLRCLEVNSTFRPSDFDQFDKNTFLLTAENHRLTNIIYTTLKTNHSFPIHIKNCLRERYVANKLRMLSYMAELCRVLKILNVNRIKAVALKGPLLGHLYYDDYTQRECKDLDILVHETDVQKAYEILLDLGYNLSNRLWNSPKQKAIYDKTYYHYNLYSSKTNVQIELHWRLNASGSDSIIKSKSSWDTLPVIQACGQTIPILPRNDMFIYLCIHGGMHQWKRLFWLVDIVRIIEREDADFLAKIFNQLSRKSEKRYVLEACHLAYVIFGIDLHPSILEAIEKDTNIGRLSKVSIFSMSNISDVYLSPLSSFKTFSTAIHKFIKFYWSAIYLDGYKAIYTSFSNFFINPAYWAIYSFRDSLFLLNYFAAPFLWIYTLFNKVK
ncbi:nucleotidyltransferase family protein [Spirosoma aureum]|uniref:Nucleotidyltransferase family protein n=1 Tax=Spirosoma aureum TaxID=2692134 RepID=A0A6G9ANL4_9BACT|nr:nucleotidyltransferase family protein [Spirosoma aureum]QIP13926.1 nucleotidyltransferase family protein [Spirosoma aureum]